MSDVLEQTLSALGSPEDLQRKASDAYRRVAGGPRMVIAGSGHLGRLALLGARRAGLDVAAFADNNASLLNTAISGVPVMTPEVAFNAFGNDVFAVVAIYNPTPLREQLRSLGFARVVPYGAFFWEHADLMPEETRLEMPARILEAAAPMRHAYRCLSDQRSRIEFAAQIAWRCSLDYSRLPAPDPVRDMYFGSDVTRLSRDEVLVDCGAFDGDTIRMFCKRTSGAFRRIYAIEPDLRNRERLRQYLSTWRVEDRDRVTVMPYGVGGFNGPVAFASDGTVGSHVSVGTVDSQIECRTLDSLLAGEPVTFIKMDIEGAEPDALQGAARLIQEARPVVAACGYHACDHLWRLPRILAEIVPDYHIVLRRYAEECWETVYYAVPPERVSE